MKSNLSCVIIDDEPKAIELLKDCLGYLFPNITVFNTFVSWSTALPVLKTTAIDIVFLDISMPGKSGMDLLTLLPDLESEVIFVTAHSEPALKAFNFAPSGYILKPVDDTLLSHAINHAIKRIHHRRQSNQSNSTATIAKIGIPNNKGTDYLNINDIFYFESINNCTKIVTIDGDIISSYTLNRFKQIVDKHSFFQVHRSYIVNLNCIKRYTTDGGVLMSNGSTVPISRNYREDFLLIFNKVSKNDLQP